MRTSFLLSVVTCFVLIISCTNKTIESTPTSRIIDNSRILTNPQQDSILTLIEKVGQEVGSEIGILTIDTLGKENLEEFSLGMARAMGLGRASHDDGILITVVTLERKIRIEVGTGLENIVTDEIAAEIIRNEIVPSFREGKYGKGLYLAVERISRLIIENKDLVGTEPKVKI